MILNAVHENYQCKWYTPENWLSWVVETLGGGYSDPCPAGYGDGEDDDGLISDRNWKGRVYVNHPGARGSAKIWWSRAVEMMQKGVASDLVWCAFSAEQLRHMEPSPLLMTGWLVMPRKRISFINARTGEPGRQPSNWTVFWASLEPAETPEPCVIIRTGVQ